MLARIKTFTINAVKARLSITRLRELPVSVNHHLYEGFSKVIVRFKVMIKASSLFVIKN